MQHYLQFSVAGGLLLAGTLALLPGIRSTSAERSPAPDQPRVEAATHKAYAETIAGSKVKETWTRGYSSSAQALPP